MKDHAAPPAAPTKAARLRALLHSPRLEFLMEAHNGLSARIVEQTGFDGIWASGLTMSAALGVRDSNEASWTQVLDVLEFMSDATSVPILMDGDTGFGNFNNTRRLVRKLCQRGIAGVAIEDKLFPKTNSFIGEGQPLADVEEFCGKIKAAKDSQLDPGFCVVARIEAFIAGRGLEEALARGEAYVEAGADAVLIHSKRAEPDEILDFASAWDNRAPVVIVPTKYYRADTQLFRDAGISLAIWANHNLRASIAAMRETSRRIYESESLLPVEDGIASVAEVFRLQDSQELAEAEGRYLPQRRAPSAVVLAAARGAALGRFTEELPKCMLDIRGRPLLSRLVGTLREGGVGTVTVVRGYRKEAIDVDGIVAVDNDAYESTGEVASLDCAREALAGECLVVYGDILFSGGVLSRLARSPHDVTLVVDAGYRRALPESGDRRLDLVSVSRPYSGLFLDDDDPAVLRGVGVGVDRERADGEWIGLARFSERGCERLRETLERLRREGRDRAMLLPELIRRLLDDGAGIGVVYVDGGWLDVNDVHDLAAARNVVER